MINNHDCFIEVVNGKDVDLISLNIYINSSLKKTIYLKIKKEANIIEL